jgi:uncharacterized protein YndB with AHSA1/START domain
MIEIRVEAMIDVEPMLVWAALADHENMHKWMNVQKVVRCRPGLLEPDGVGAVRRLYATGRVMEERITKFEPGRCLEYDVLKGAPGWVPHGQVTLTPIRDGGTLVCWKVTLHPYVPSTGWLIKRFLERSLTRALEQLKDRLEPVPLLAFQKQAAADVASVAVKQRRLQKPRVARESTPGL